MTKSTIKIVYAVLQAIVAALGSLIPGRHR
jgi:hypothetical protein